MGAQHYSTKKIGFSAVIVLSALLLAAFAIFSGRAAYAAALPGGASVPLPVPTQAATGTSVPGATATNTPTHGVPTPPPTAVPTICPMNFSDVAQGDWFYAYVNALYCHGAISGYADGTFRPYNDTTRGQLSKIIVLAAAWQINTTGGPHFSDVPATNPFYSYVETAYNRGIISGYADGTFRWGNNITRGQLSKIVVLARNWSLNSAGGPHFSDVAVGSPFYGYVETAYNKGVVSGYLDGTFRPGSDATRAQLSKIVQMSLLAP